MYKELQQNQQKDSESLKKIKKDKLHDQILYKRVSMKI